MFVRFHERTDEPCVDNLPYAEQVKHWEEQVKYWSAMRVAAPEFERIHGARKHALDSSFEEQLKKAEAELAILADVMWLSAADIARELDLSVQHVTKWLESGQIKAVNPSGTDWLIHRADYEEFLISRRNVPTSRTWKELEDRFIAKRRADRKRAVPS